MKPLFILLALIAFLFHARPADAAIAVVQAAIGGVGNSTSPSRAFASPTTAGNFLVAFVTTSGSGTITAPSGWSTAVSVPGTNGIPGKIFYKENASSISTVTASLTVSGRWTIEISEYSGIGTSSLDQTGSGNAASGAIPSGTVNTNFANELLIACYTNNFADTFSTPTSSFTLRDQQSTGAQTAGAYTDRIVSSTGSYSSTLTAGNGGDGMIATFGVGTPIGGNSNTAIWQGMNF